MIIFLQVVIYKSISKEKLSAYAELAGPFLMKALILKFLARRIIPVAVREEGQKTRTVVVEWGKY